MNSNKRVTRDAPNSIYKNNKKQSLNKKLELRKSAEELSENKKF